MGTQNTLIFGQPLGLVVMPDPGFLVPVRPGRFGAAVIAGPHGAATASYLIVPGPNVRG